MLKESDARKNIRAASFHRIFHEIESAPLFNTSQLCWGHTPTHKASHLQLLTCLLLLDGGSGGRDLALCSVSQTQGLCSASSRSLLRSTAEVEISITTGSQEVPCRMSSSLLCDVCNTRPETCFVPRVLGSMWLRDGQVHNCSISRQGPQTPAP